MINKLAIASMLVLATVFPAQAQSRMDWLNIANFSGGMGLDVDLNSVRRSNSLVGYVTRVRLPYPDRSGAILIAYQEIADCSSGEFQTLGVVAINRQKQIIFNQQRKNAPIQQVESGSPRYEALGFICQRKTQEETIADFHKALLDAYKLDIPSLVEAIMRSRYY